MYSAWLHVHVYGKKRAWCFVKFKRRPLIVSTELGLVSHAALGGPATLTVNLITTPKGT